jgi:hypothetical protein
MRTGPRKSSSAGALDFYRTVIAVVMVAALVWTLSWLQGRYDASDHRKAIELVQSYKATPKGPTIPQRILARHPGLEEHYVSWSSEITSSCLGVVRVSAFVPKQADREAVTYAFDVRLTDPSIHPTDPATIEILKSLTATTSTVSRSPG